MYTNYFGDEHLILSFKNDLRYTKAPYVASTLPKSALIAAVTIQVPRSHLLTGMPLPIAHLGIPSGLVCLGPQWSVKVSTPMLDSMLGGGTPHSGIAPVLQSGRARVLHVGISIAIC